MEVRRNVVTTFYRVKVLSHNNNDDKLLKLQSKFDFEASLLSVLHKTGFSR